MWLRLCVVVLRGEGRTRPCPGGRSQSAAAQANPAAAARWRSARWRPGCGTSASTSAPAGPRRSHASSLRIRFLRRASVPGGQPHPFRAGQHVRGVAAVVGVDGCRRAPPTSWCTTASRNQRSWLTTTSAFDAQRRQVLGQPADDLDVEMVRRLVEHQHVVAGQQHRGQRDPAPFAAAEVPTSLSRSTLGQQVLDDGAGLGFGRPDVVGPAADDDVADGRIGGEVVGSDADNPPTDPRCG